jgi:hypothetical protein
MSVQGGWKMRYWRYFCLISPETLLLPSATSDSCFGVRRGRAFCTSFNNENDRLRTWPEPVFIAMSEIKMVDVSVPADNLKQHLATPILHLGTWQPGVVLCYVMIPTTNNCSVSDPLKQLICSPTGWRNLNGLSLNLDTRATTTIILLREIAVSARMSGSRSRASVNHVSGVCIRQILDCPTHSRTGDRP